MGTWGTGVFDNDTANDWAYDLGECDDLEYVETTIDKVLEVADEYLEAPVAEEALAAAEVIARARGRQGVKDAYTQKIDEWLAARTPTPSSALIAKAVAAIDRIVSAPSEILELWEEGGETDDSRAWKRNVAELRERLLS